MAITFSSSSPLILGVSCINPPVPPADRHLVVLYEEGTTVDFFHNVTYECEEGYYFDEDFYKESFEVMCTRNPDGNWTDLPPEQHCVDPASESSKSISHNFMLSACLLLLSYTTTYGRLRCPQF